ncbi:hypothetical protein [Okeania sp. SIO2C9]|nr:hypothetical protein [Okeania sp. SIO2C9]
MAFPLNDYIYEVIAQLTNHLTKISLCEALEKKVGFGVASQKKLG